MLSTENRQPFKGAQLASLIPGSARGTRTGFGGSPKQTLIRVRSNGRGQKVRVGEPPALPRIPGATRLKSDRFDLTTWMDLGSSVAGAATNGPGFVVETGAAPNFTVEVRDTVPYDSSPLTKRFLRLKITSP
jgi:hypothetical protein